MSTWRSDPPPCLRGGPTALSTRRSDRPVYAEVRPPPPPSTRRSDSPVYAEVRPFLSTRRSDPQGLKRSSL